MHAHMGDSVWEGPEPLPNTLDTLALSNIYSRTAAFYDAVVAEKQAAAKLVALDMLARRPEERFLEVGVGTAWAFARLVAASGPERAIGVDVAPGMLQVGADALREGGVGAPPLVLADGLALPFATGSLDCILNTYTFEVMALPDIGAMLQETLRVLRPGGRFVAVNLTDATDGDEEAEAMIEDWKARYLKDPEAFGGARPLQLMQSLRAHGFERVTRRYVGPDWPSEVLLAFKPG